LFQGIRTKFWPPTGDSYVIQLNETEPTLQHLYLSDLQLENGAAYSLQVTALNLARMSAIEESEPVIVDTTPPLLLQVHVTLCEIGIGTLTD
jgi:hypothetical protein